MTPKRPTKAQAHAERLQGMGFNAIDKDHEVIIVFAGHTIEWHCRCVRVVDAKDTLKDLCRDVARRVIRNEGGLSGERGPHDFSGVRRALAAVDPAHREALRDALARRLRFWADAIADTTQRRQWAVDAARAVLAKEEQRLAQIVGGLADARAALGEVAL